MNIRNDDIVNLKKEILALKKQLKEQGYFHPDLLSTALQLSAIFLFIFSSYYLLLFDSWPLVILSSCALAAYFCLMAYLTHDLAHGQISKNRFLLQIGYLLLSFGQGWSVSWWKWKHNLHHMHPNGFSQNEKHIKILDNDIDALPFICWDKKLIPQHSSAFTRKLLALQKYYVWILFLGLRPFWSYMGLLKGPWREKLLIVLHFIVFLGAASLLLPHQVGLIATWWILGNIFSGFALSSFFLFGHSGQEVYEVTTSANFFHSQLRSSQNFHDNIVIRFFSGYLGCQIEHHFFPTMPSSRLHKVAPQVRELIENHEQTYTLVSIPEAYRKIYRTLDIKHDTETTA